MPAPATPKRKINKENPDPEEVNKKNRVRKQQTFLSLFTRLPTLSLHQPNTRRADGVDASVKFRFFFLYKEAHAGEENEDEPQQLSSRVRSTPATQHIPPSCESGRKA